MEDSTRESLLDTVAEYAEVVEAAGVSEQSRSMAAAFALDALYEDGSWVDEWLEQSEKPTTPRQLAQWQPDSRNRFAKWQEWKQSERNRKAVANRTMYQLLQAAEIADSLRLRKNGVCANANVTEGVLRPLGWMLKHEERHRLPDVWARAVDEAGSVDQLTAKTVTSARNDWRTETFGASSHGITPTKQKKRSRGVERYREKHLELRREIQEFGKAALRDHAVWDEWAALLEEINGVARSINEAAVTRQEESA